MSDEPTQDDRKMLLALQIGNAILSLMSACSILGHNTIKGHAEYMTDKSKLTEFVLAFATGSVTSARPKLDAVLDQYGITGSLERDAMEKLAALLLPNP